MKILLGESYLIIKDTDEVYPVHIYFEDLKLKKGNAYAKGDTVYIYHGKLKNSADPSIPGIYKTSSGYIFVEPTEEERRDIYNIDKVVEIDALSIVTRLETQADRFQRPEDIEIINSNSECYKPTITEDDDFLKVLIKKAILNKNININQYKHRFKNEFDLNNKKSGLKKSTKMTVNNFKEWCEILDLKWSMSLYDSGDDVNNPLPEDIEITSDDF